MLIDFKIVEVRKKYFLFQNQKLNRGKKEMLCEIDSLVALPPPKSVRYGS